MNGDLGPAEQPPSVVQYCSDNRMLDNFEQLLLYMYPGSSSVALLTYGILSQFAFQSLKDLLPPHALEV